MGNILGIECSFNYVHVTTVLINKKLIKESNNDRNNEKDIREEKEKKLPKNVSIPSNDNKINMNVYLSWLKEKYKKEYINFEEDVSKSDEYNNCDDDYIKMKKNTFSYILDMQHIIDSNVQVFSLKKNSEKNVHTHISINELYKCFHEDDNLEKKFIKYLNFVKYHKLDNSQIDTVNIQHLYDDEIAEIYFWSFKLKYLDECILKYYKKNINYMIINVTGKNKNLIKNKFHQITGKNNIFHHNEIKCINNSICFLKRFMPTNLYYFTKYNEENERASCTSQNDDDDERKKKKKNLLYQSFINKDEVSEIKSYVIVNMKRAVCYHLVNEQNLIERIGTLYVGFRTVMGLFLLITGRPCSLQRICQLAKNGTNRTFDMTVQDIYGTSYSNAGLCKDLTASFFGNAQHIENVKNIFNTYDEEKNINIKEEDDKLMNVYEYENESSCYENVSSCMSTEISECQEIFETEECIGFEAEKNNNNYYRNKYSFLSKDKTKKLLVSNKNFNVHDNCKIPIFNFNSDSYCNYTSSFKSKEKLFKHNIEEQQKQEEGYKQKEDDNFLMNDIDNYLSIKHSLSDNEINMYKYHRKNYNLKKSFLKKLFKKQYLNENGKIIHNINLSMQKEVSSFILKNKKRFSYKTYDEQIVKKACKSITLKNVCSETNKNKMDSNLKDKTIVKYNTNMCDLSRSLLSMAIFTTVYLSYIHCNLYNADYIFFTGYNFEDDVCKELFQIIIKFLSHNRQKIYFAKISKYISSLGSAIELINWERVHIDN
ncbi:pantothenate kinase, putative [Plasmodium reichenowi]|uniref:Pantothenate kinase, putative n=1 Tax=Plasmodium reichenowi TaxID=5854 RepID=A0A151L592_PLARE|nr:pantothenate kinase, putative [Plasmodium reichenowi]KYN94027.1 pantothenate kinase, putative [Plasmodium reichenowi]